MYSRRGFVERVDRVTGHSWRINCRRHFRRSDGCPANKSNLGTVALDDGRLSRFRKIPARPAMRHIHGFQDFHAANQGMQPMVGMRIICLVHEIEPGAHVRRDRRLVHARPLVSIVLINMLAIGNDRFQIAECDICSLDKMFDRLENLVRIGPPDESIAHQHHIDVIHSSAPLIVLCHILPAPLLPP